MALRRNVSKRELELLVGKQERAQAPEFPSLCESPSTPSPSPRRSSRLSLGAFGSKHSSPRKMSSKFKEDSILMIAPGSQTTLAQIGVPEQMRPAAWRFPTRMFPGEKPGTFEPMRVIEKKAKKNVSKPATEDVAQSGENASASTTHEEEETVYEEDPTSDEGAIYPIQGGQIVDWKCFTAFLMHVHNKIGPNFHTPILILTQPGWTRKDRELLALVTFQRFKVPAFTTVDAHVAALWAYGVSSATVIDVGYEKCDVTALAEFVPCGVGRGIAIPDCGGEAMTKRLLDLLGAKGFDHGMCERLKRSVVCEVLPLGVALPSETEAPEVTNPAAAATTGSNGTAAGASSNAKPPPAQTSLPRGPGPNTETGEEPAEDKEGVLDVASIVASGKTTEFLAKKEREKAEKAAKRAAEKAAAGAEAAAALRAKLPNSQRAKAIFHFDKPRGLEDEPEPKKDEPKKDEPRKDEPQKDEPKEDHPREDYPKEDKPRDDAPNAQALNNGEPKTDVQTNGDAAPPVDDVVQQMETTTLDKKEEKKRNKESSAFVRKEIEVGVERFQAADQVVERIADAVHRVILAVPEVSKRADLWDSMIIIGNGARLRGFKERLMATLHAKYLISPSSATMFTSELPSNFSTPVPTGANTPLPQPQPTHHASGVNPLLLAATTAQNPALGTPRAASLHPPGGPQTPGGPPQQQHAQHFGGGHSQGPSSIRLAKTPEYFPEWKEGGFEEAHFLGAQFAARALFIVDQGADKGYMTRVEYNDEGPMAIHRFSVG